jgi:polyribonucleotide nucleotidyltransferase
LAILTDECHALQIQELSGAQIYVDPRADDGVEATMRNVTIQGNSEQMSKAKQLVNEIVARHKQQEQSRKENPSRGDLPMQDFFAIPSNVVSSIIGRGGSSIKAMKDETGCSIFIENKADDGGVESVERKVTIRGNVDNVKRARFLIEEKVKEAMQSNLNFLTGGGGGGPGGGRGKGPGNRRNKLFQSR